LITLKVLDLEGRRVYHTMKMNDRLQGVMDAYYKKVADVTYGSGTFMFDESIRLRGTNTPSELDLNDEDEIEFFPTMIGGGWVGS
jgi:small ubiquitin-related modifier